MAIINLLDRSVYNKIAAGEVIERPASVVKELVENSIDAEADEITIKLVDSGVKEIEVSDNCYGMDESNISYTFSAILKTPYSSKAFFCLILFRGRYTQYLCFSEEKHSKNLSMSSIVSTLFELLKKTAPGNHKYMLD